MPADILFFFDITCLIEDLKNFDLKSLKVEVENLKFLLGGSGSRVFKHVIE